MPGEYPLHSPHGVPDAGLYRMRCYPGCCGGEHNRNAYSYTDYYRYYCSSNYYGYHCYTDYYRYYCSSNHYGYHRYTDYYRYYCSPNHYGYHRYTDYYRYYGYPTGCIIHCIAHLGHCTSHRAV